MPDVNHYTLHAHEIYVGSLSRKPPHLRKPDDRAPVLRFGAGHWKLILRKPDDRAPVLRFGAGHWKLILRKPDAINLPGQA